VAKPTIVRVPGYGLSAIGPLIANPSCNHPR
jgi:hypothetical protein